MVREHLQEPVYRVRIIGPVAYEKALNQSALQLRVLIGFPMGFNYRRAV